jgi:hypothetical protein
LPIGRLIAENLRAHRDDGSPGDEYVGFGDDGTGNPSCVRRDEGDAVYYWNPILDEITLLGDDLLSFWHRCNDGTLPPH